MLSGICPECEEEIYVDEDAEEGDIVDCEECGARLELLSLSPVEFVIIEDEYEDYDDSDFDYESYDYEDDRY
ncbi:MAG: hypothetical protein N2Z23_05605 [Pyrinomonadaceae bacterium]|nr:hypothetical protein [Pyrinomonadaceae bacterium]MCX7639901.1 hypothetical protein [Pyrinomonadaceae bacterium]MDW8304073.1 hypothetical protein [Acidobacteriota bacterium]